ncbi:MAG TPA: pyridoxal-phosphate dependent enzyme [Candidatus Limnocylindrales bacterium]|nr:pyridoxal-phosphate dependent enzyme [Candidatus Limnocylindrales bacterium]
MSLSALNDPRLDEAGVTVRLFHDSNKPRKLKYNLLAAKESGHRILITAGGAYSNHLPAVARIGREQGFLTRGVVRGEPVSNPSLERCRADGMELSFMDRASFRTWERHADTSGCHVIPIGGSNALGAKGCAEIAGDIDEDYDLICCPVGTGGTLAGLAEGLPEGKRALGFAVLKGGGFLNDDVKRLQREAFGHATGNWSINLDFHCGGYAKRDDRLDPRWERVHVAKMMLGISTLAGEGKLNGARVVALITG